MKFFHFIPVLYLFSSANGYSCPKLCRCENENTEIWCSIREEADLVDILRENIRAIHFEGWPNARFDFNVFENATNLEEIDVSNSDSLQSVSLPTERIGFLSLLKSLSFRGNQFDNISAISLLTEAFHRLEKLDFSKNKIYLSNSTDPILENPEGSQLKILDLSRNQIEVIPEGLPNRLTTLDLSGNRISRLNEPITSNWRIRSLNLADNWISLMEPSFISLFSNLRSLNLSRNPLNQWDLSRPLSHPTLEVLDMANSEMRWINFQSLSGLEKLQNLSLKGSARLSVVLGKLSQLPSLRNVDLSDCKIRTFNRYFFSYTKKEPISVNIESNPFACHSCLLVWAQKEFGNVRVGNLSEIKCSEPESRKNTPVNSWATNQTCDLEVMMEDGAKIMAPNLEEFILHCDAVGTDPPKVTWKRLTPVEETIGQWDPKTQDHHVVENLTGTYEIIPGGDLIIRKMEFDLKGDLQCIAESPDGRNVSAVVALRVDFSSWTIEVKVFSVFCGIATALGFFLLNVLWASLRSFILWRISQSERKGRVRRMLEAMEKYRQRQVETLHEKYTHRLNLIRDNYNSQAEQLHKSYASQAGRFRDYKAQQMEHVSHGIDNLRDNYSVQIGRVRDYGSRQMERLWENYQRQMNRIRTFSLQQRLRMMHTYKIKQRYLNSLLESMYANGTVYPGSESPGREMMPMPSLTEDGREDLYDIPVISFRRSESDTLSVSTYHSLPPDDEELDSNRPSTSKQEFV